MNRWDVYWADVPFDEDKTQNKRRPVIIAKDEEVYVLVIRMTSHEARTYDPYDYTLKEWQFAGLEKASVVRIRKISRLMPESIYGFIGKIHPIDILEIQKRMFRYQKERNTVR